MLRRLHPSDHSEEDLSRIYFSIKTDLEESLKDEQGHRDPDLTEAVLEVDHSGAITSLGPGKNLSLETRARRLHSALKHLSLTAYDRNGQVVLLPGNPRLSKLLSSWQKEKYGDVAYYLCHYERPLPPQGSGRETSKRPRLDRSTEASNSSEEEDKINLAYVVINYRRSEVFLYFLSPTPEKTDDSTRTGDPFGFDKYVLARYQGDYRTAEDQVFLSFKQRAITKGKRETELNDEQHLLLVLPLEVGGNRLGTSVVGNFASRGPASGLCFLEECSPGQLADMLKRPNVNNTIRQLLTNRTISARTSSRLYDLEHHRQLLEQYAGYAGKYTGYGLINANSKDRGKLRKALIELKPDGSIVIRPTGKEEPMYGRLYYIRSTEKTSQKGLPDTLCFNLKYTDELASYQLLIFLQRVPDKFARIYNMQHSLVGTYSGLFKDELQPRTGKFFLRRNDDMQPKDTENMPFGKGERFDNLIRSERYLLPFFAGFGDYNSDHPYKMRPRLMERVLFTQINRDSRRREAVFAGDYLLYYPSSKPMKNAPHRTAEVFQRPLRIDPSTLEVTWYDEITNGTLECFIGSLALVEHSISVRFNEMRRHLPNGETDDNRPTDRSLVFHVGPAPKKTAPGEPISCKIYRQNTIQHPVMSDAVLVKTTFKDTDTTTIANLIQTVTDKPDGQSPECEAMVRKLFVLHPGTD